MKLPVFAAALLIFALSVEYSRAEVCQEVTPGVIKKHLAIDEFTVVSIRELNGLCEIVINSDNRLVTFYGNRKFLVSGEMYENGVSLTERKLYDINRAMLKSSVKDVDECVAFTYTPPEIKTETVLYMFTDPLCPFCNRIGGEVKDLSDRLGFRVSILLMNVHGEKGRAKCMEAVCRNEADPAFNLGAYNGQEWKKGDPDSKFACQKGEELVDKTEKLSEKLGIDSVPFFFIKDGRHVNGASIEDVELLFKPEK